MHAFRSFVQAEMDKRGWKAVDLVSRSGLSKQVVSNILNDDRDELPGRPGRQTVDSLARAFSVPSDVVLLSIGEAMGIPVASPVVIYDASRVPNDELLRVLAQRLGEDGGEHVGSAPITPAGGSPAQDARAADELASRRASRETDVPDPASVPDRAVANEDESLGEEGIAQLEDP